MSTVRMKMRLAEEKQNLLGNDYLGENTLELQEKVRKKKVDTHPNLPNPQQEAEKKELKIRNEMSSVKNKELDEFAKTAKIDPFYLHTAYLNSQSGPFVFSLKCELPPTLKSVGVPSLKRR